MRKHITLTKIPFTALVFGLSMSLLGLTACTDNDSGKAIQAPKKGGDGDGPGGSEKISKAPPVYDSSQWNVGTSWTWKKLKEKSKDPKKSICLRWSVLGNTTADGVTIQQNTSGDCAQMSGATNLIRFHFFPHNGEVDWVAYGSGSPQPPKAKTSVYGHLFGNDHAGSVHYRKDLKNPWTTLDVYSPENSKAWYINAPGTPLHGVLWRSEELELFQYSP